MIRARAVALLVVGFALLSVRAVAAEVDLGLLEHTKPQQTDLFG
jgi:hypothetical protein